MSLIDVMLQDSPISLWVLDETTGTTAKDSVHLADGTYTSTFTLGAAALFPAGPKSVSLPGGAGYVTIPDNAAYSSSHSGASGKLTLEAFVYPTTVSAQRYILFKGTSGFYEFGLWMTSGGKLHANIWTGVGADVMSLDSTPSLVINSLNHVVATYNRTTPLLSVYVNNVVSSTGGASSSTTDGTSPVNIGRRSDGSQDGNSWAGQISCAAIYPTDLSAARVGAHYREAFRGGVSY